MLFTRKMFLSFARSLPLRMQEAPLPQPVLFTRQQRGRLLQVTPSLPPAGGRSFAVSRTIVWKNRMHLNQQHQQWNRRCKKTRLNLLMMQKIIQLVSALNIFFSWGNSDVPSFKFCFGYSFMPSYFHLNIYFDILTLVCQQIRI